MYTLPSSTSGFICFLKQFVYSVPYARIKRRKHSCRTWSSKTMLYKEKFSFSALTKIRCEYFVAYHDIKTWHGVKPRKQNTQRIKLCTCTKHQYEKKTLVKNIQHRLNKTAGFPLCNDHFWQCFHVLQHSTYIFGALVSTPKTSPCFRCHMSSCHTRRRFKACNRMHKIQPSASKTEPEWFCRGINWLILVSGKTLRQCGPTLEHIWARLNRENT